MAASGRSSGGVKHLLAWGWLGALWLTAFAICLLAWAWRGIGGPWLLPAVMVGLAAALGLGRSAARRLAPRAVAVWGLTVVALAGAWWWVRPPEAPAPPGPGKRVAVVGAGAGGVHAAWVLDRAGADVTVFEAAPYVGGHAYAYPFEADDGTILPIDTGFMFGSPTSYKEMKALLALYGVGRTQTNLSMAGRIDGALWASGMEGLDPELLRLHTLADAGYTDTRLNLVPFWAWLWWHGFDADFQRRYLFPMLSVLFITDEGVYDVSTRFMLNMLAGPTRWLDYRRDANAWVVEGGSSAYYAKMTAALDGHIRTLHPVTKVQREDGKVRLTVRAPEGTREEVFDAVVLNVHADVARRLLADASPFEDFVLGQVAYDPVQVVVHTDHSMFPEGDLLRHYLFEAEGEQWSLHSLPGRAQRDGAAVTPDPVITLNPTRAFEGERFRKGWRHHRQDLWHLAMMLKLMPAMQGAGNVWYAGDWVTFIGHGPAMMTGMSAACNIAGKEPRADLPTAPCVDVQLTDPMPHAGVERETQRMCGEADVFRHVVKLSCSGKLGP
jgi:predicted NAD/FAD-binding protein